ncbi:MAG TPA: VWA-like domain-containing protein [Candidatus Competibacter denitrificans]|nr:hypothetical protein [Candidatus Competibacteraceae bacterium]HRC69821.1 VWA-like domain-containing protein [Candidatus Competibacter denitrificans]
MSAPAPALERLLSRALLRLRAKNPFFATLALFARLEGRAGVKTAVTDGRAIWFNPDYVATLQLEEFQALLIHEVLHCALLHPLRRGNREPALWNSAADIVVNGMIAADTGLSLPKDAVRAPELEALAVEEVYEALLAGRRPCPILPEAWRDLLEPAVTGHHQGGAVADEVVSEGEILPCGADPDEPGATRRRADLEAYWKTALRQAEAVARASGQDVLPAGLAREVEWVEGTRLDWRSHLWRFVVRTPSDFSGFDRRFVGQGLYLDALEGESVAVRIAVDTSGSVNDELIGQFLGEVRGILAAYPQIDARLWYADAALYGPYDLRGDQPLPEPVGGGGTSFRPFFAASEQDAAPRLGERLAVYLTDGYGDFPNRAPEGPVLWVVAPGGLASESFPFGEVARLA